MLSHSRFHIYEGFGCVCGKLGVTEVQKVTADISGLMKPMYSMCTSAEVTMLHKKEFSTCRTAFSLLPAFYSLC